jgi:hypothetical protein
MRAEGAGVNERLRISCRLRTRAVVPCNNHGNAKWPPLSAAPRYCAVEAATEPTAIARDCRASGLTAEI